ncbi:MAG: carboxylesterase/lipase family protein [Synergistaceae bacterium]|nr:carboxylesterase/lipase family protein [Synergistaceae bacterium]
MVKKFVAFILLLQLLALCVPCSVCSAENKLSAECSNGTFEGFLSSDVIAWLGVPYAKAPVGNLRWKAPEAPDADTGTFEAKKISAMPIQRVNEGNYASQMPQDEDCLYLNIWKKSADVANVDSRPVMVWIHGGSFRANGTGEPEWTGHQLAADNPDIMVVSVGYRLGLMGFIDFSEVSGGENFAESGNLGILDVLQSLKWLKENVEKFGGDPENITLFGQSSGSALISLLMTVPEAQGLFQRAILQSGSVSMSMTRADATELADKLLALTGKTDMTGLMSLTSSDLQNAANKLEYALNFPELDGVVLTSGDIYTAFAENAGNYDLLIGSNANEANYFLGASGMSLDIYSGYVSSAYEQITDAMQSIPVYGASMLEAAEDFIALQGDIEPVWAYSEFLNELLFRVPAIQMASSRIGSGKTYMYYWNIPSVIPYLGACHASEIPYVFDVPGILVPDAVLNSEQGKAVRALVQGMWVDFAKDGVISNRTQYESGDRTTIMISSNATVISEENDPLSQQRQLIMSLLAMGVSGREIINAISAGTGTGDEDNNVSPDNPSAPDNSSNPNNSDNGSTDNISSVKTVAPNITADNARKALGVSDSTTVFLLQPNDSTHWGTTANKASDFTSRVSSGQKPVLAFPALTASEAGVYTFGISRADLINSGLKTGDRIFLNMFSTTTSSVSAAVDSGTYKFFNSAGEEITTVPANGNIDAAVYLESGTYVPVVTAENTNSVIGVGSSSGGCELGFSVSGVLGLMALVLTFKRKRKAR